MKTMIVKCPSGYYAVMVWDDDRNDWSMWSASFKNAEEAARGLADFITRTGGVS